MPCFAEHPADTQLEQTSRRCAGSYPEHLQEETSLSTGLKRLYNKIYVWLGDKGFVINTT